MIKSTLILCALLLTIMPLARAEQAESLRDMATQAMFEYGEKLYDRHDYKEAEHVFKRILVYDPQNAGAIAYLNNMHPDTVIRRPMIIQAVKLPMPHPVEVPRQVQTPAVIVPASPNADLKEEIATQDRMIDELKQEIHRMQVEINS